jgi:hypothetical protein
MQGHLLCRHDKTPWRHTSCQPRRSCAHPRLNAPHSPQPARGPLRRCFLYACTTKQVTTPSIPNTSVPSHLCSRLRMGRPMRRPSVTGPHALPHSHQRVLLDLACAGPPAARAGPSAGLPHSPRQGTGSEGEHASVVPPQPTCALYVRTMLVGSTQKGMFMGSCQTCHSAMSHANPTAMTWRPARQQRMHEEREDAASPTSATQTSHATCNSGACLLQACIKTS